MRTSATEESPDLHGSATPEEDEGYSPDTEDGKKQGVAASVGLHFHVHTIEEIVNASDDPPPAIIDGVLCEIGIMTVSGRAKSWKSWDAIQPCLSMPLGQLWHRREVKKVPTVYVNLELPEASLLYRVKKIAAAMGLKDLRELKGWFTPITIDCSSLMVAQMKLAVGIGADGMYTHLLMQQIAQAIEDSKMHNPKFICLDSFYKLVGGLNENAAEDVTCIYGHRMYTSADPRYRTER